MNVTTGVIAAAGAGTRMLPVTLGCPKELLPIIDKPAIQLIIEEFVDSGLKKIIIVTGQYAEPIHRQYNLSNLPQRGAFKDLDAFVDRLVGVEIIFEPQVGPYGNGTPLMVASEHIPRDEAFIYAYGDDIVKSKEPFTKELIEKHLETDALVAGVQRVALEDVSRYGVVTLKEGASELEMLDVVEKPTPEEAPSDLVLFGRFLLSHEIIDILKTTPKGIKNELWLTDSLRRYIKLGGTVIAHPISNGRWLTIGDPMNYLTTVIEFALSDPDIGPSFRLKVESILKQSN